MTHLILESESCEPEASMSGNKDDKCAMNGNSMEVEGDMQVDSQSLSSSS